MRADFLQQHRDKGDRGISWRRLQALAKAKFTMLPKLLGDDIARLEGAPENPSARTQMASIARIHSPAFRDW